MTDPKAAAQAERTFTLWAEMAAQAIEEIRRNDPLLVQAFEAFESLDPDKATTQ